MELRDACDGEFRIIVRFGLHERICARIFDVGGKWDARIRRSMPNAGEGSHMFFKKYDRRKSMRPSNR